MFPLQEWITTEGEAQRQMTETTEPEVPPPLPSEPRNNRSESGRWRRRGKTTLGLRKYLLLKDFFNFKMALTFSYLLK